MLLRFVSLRTLSVTAFIFCILILFTTFRLRGHLIIPNTSSSWGAPAHSPSLELEPLDQYCNTFPLSEDILVIVKTGANEIHDKLSTQLLTSLRCYKDILLFSDLEQNIGPFKVHDALKHVSNTTKAESPDFDYYRQLQEDKKNDQDISSLRRKSGSAAWNLDKYKFLHMLEETWMMKPHRKWYIFIEADTYLVRTNLLLWLERQDPSELIYYGSPTYVNGQGFAHGGSGVVLSGAALSKFAENDQGIAARYDKMLQSEAFGDYVLMKALKDKGVAFNGRWPMLQAEKPSTIPFGPGPDNGEPLLLQELYQDMVGPKVYAEREDWYNLSDDQLYRPPGVDGDRQKSREDMSALELEAHVSFEHCGRACEEQPRCFQYTYSNRECGFSYSYRLGRKRYPESGKTFIVLLLNGYDDFTLCIYSSFRPELCLPIPNSPKAAAPSVNFGWDFPVI
ncbi:hypothetical protein B0A52_04149 [Exophiala mesophila]|uniref:Apple domain-containing protein n=1 Tax=Exophiala mesophila TaxID=212818 RepID=A0A438NAF0_EXOME|nr:hypothetical protein B0A52_04149 [Exophiala mesophila]